MLADLPDESWYSLIELLRAWAYERTGLGYTLSKEQSATLNAGAKKILKDLVQFSTKMPGVQSQLKELAHHLNDDTKFNGSREYDIIFPREDDRRNYQEDAIKQQAAIKVLASEYAAQDPKEIIKKVIQFNKQAAAAHHSWPDHTRTLATELAEVVDNPGDWAEACIETWDKPEFSFPFLLALQQKDPEAAMPILLAALDHDRHKYAAAEVILRREFSDDNSGKSCIL